MPTDFVPGTPNPKTPIAIPGRDAARLFVQAAFLRCHNDGATMVRLLREGVLAALPPDDGGAFGTSADACYSGPMGTSCFDAGWEEDFRQALEEAISQVRV